MKKKVDNDIIRLNAYAILNIAPNATVECVKKAYRKLCLVIHPDKDKENPRATSLFRRLKAIYNVLLDPGNRETYDRLHKQLVDCECERVILFKELEERIENQIQSRRELLEKIFAENISNDGNFKLIKNVLKNFFFKEQFQFGKFKKRLLDFKNENVCEYGKFLIIEFKAQTEQFENSLTVLKKYFPMFLKTELTYLLMNMMTKELENDFTTREEKCRQSREDFEAKMAKFYRSSDDSDYKKEKNCQFKQPKNDHSSRNFETGTKDNEKSRYENCNDPKKKSEDLVDKLESLSLNEQETLKNVKEYAEREISAAIIQFKIVAHKYLGKSFHEPEKDF